MKISVFVARVMWPFRWYFMGTVVVMGLWSIDLTLRPYITKWILNTAAQGPSDTLLYHLSLLCGLFCLTLAIVVTAFRVYNWLVMKMEPALRCYISDFLMSHVLQHSHTFYQKHMSGSLTDHINNVARSVPQLIKVIVERFVLIFFALTIAFMSMMKFHPVLAFVMMAWVIVFIVASLLSAHSIQELSDQASEARSKATGCITDTFSNMASVRLFTGEEYEKQLLHAAFEKTSKAEQNRDWFLLKIQAFHTFSFLVLEIISLAILVRGVTAGWVTPGDFALVLGINFSLIWVLWGLMQDLTIFIKSIGEISQGLKVLTSPYDMVDAPQATTLHVTKGTIEFRNVSFGYSPVHKIFNNLSVIIPSGQKVGLVGYSGSGKSSFFNVLLRLYDIQEGHVFIDQQDIALVTQESLRKAIALIPQDPSLFYRSLRDNIGYGRPLATYAEIVAAARHAHADEFIEGMSEKYDMLVGERGLSLSGGQRQRIAIARAFLKDAPILLLDEATSALDSIIESYIQDSLEQLMKGKTTLVIAHRLSTLIHMDRILVFDKGQIVEDGTHGELLIKNGKYAELWKAQVHGFLRE